MGLFRLHKTRTICLPAICNSFALSGIRINKRIKKRINKRISIKKRKKPTESAPLIRTAYPQIPGSSVDSRFIRVFTSYGSLKISLCRKSAAARISSAGFSPVSRSIVRKPL